MQYSGNLLYIDDLTEHFSFILLYSGNKGGNLKLLVSFMCLSRKQWKNVEFSARPAERHQGFDQMHILRTQLSQEHKA